MKEFREALVDGLAITGCDFLRFDADGRINDFMVMVRPLKAAQALAARMGGAPSGHRGRCNGVGYCPWGPKCRPPMIIGRSLNV